MSKFWHMSYSTYNPLTLFYLRLKTVRLYTMTAFIWITLVSSSWWTNAVSKNLSRIPSTWTWYAQCNQLHTLRDSIDLVAAQSSVHHTVDCITSLSLQYISDKCVHSRNENTKKHNTEQLLCTNCKILNMCWKFLFCHGSSVTCNQSTYLPHS